MQHKQSGFVFITVLLFVTILTLIVVSSLKSIWLQTTLTKHYVQYLRSSEGNDSDGDTKK